MKYKFLFLLLLLSCNIYSQQKMQIGISSGYVRNYSNGNIGFVGGSNFVVFFKKKISIYSELEDNIIKSYKNSVLGLIYKNYYNFSQKKKHFINLNVNFNYALFNVNKVQFNFFTGLSTLLIVEPLIYGINKNTAEKEKLTDNNIDFTYGFDIGIEIIYKIKNKISLSLQAKAVNTKYDNPGGYPKSFINSFISSTVGIKYTFK